MNNLSPFQHFSSFLYLHVIHIRVVKAFQAGLDRREPSLTGQSAARLREISRQLRLQVDSENRARSTSRGNIKETNNL
ncbi:hypothetical protein CAEBREN_10247 [Caenorhabditis brenneri]|uniref:Uncharacterized protein n=1 Tax=Caenorhabditis brenneri TaxID=135651 RepID=G0P8B3_CAEBE|nr:hypothetical protein CAEBREN_10247 [Caenorhabditis brenneri]